MSEKVPKAMQAKYDEIVALIEPVCRTHLNEEYAALARKLTARLARKRPSPLSSGQAKSWACGIVYALGQVNFLFDKSQTPSMPAAELCALFGVSSATAGSKAKTIRDAVDMSWMNADWQLSDRIDDNPMIWMLSVNGFLMDIRKAPFGAQLEAYQRKLIPYIPGVDMAQLDALIKQHGYLQVIDLPEDEEDDESQAGE